MDIFCNPLSHPPPPPHPITGASRWLLIPTGTLRTSWGYQGLVQNRDRFRGGGAKLTKIGEVPYFGQFMFYYDAPGWNMHRGSSKQCVPVIPNIKGVPPPFNPYFGQFLASPLHYSLFGSIYHLLVAMVSLYSNIHPMSPLFWSIYHHLRAVMPSYTNVKLHQTTPSGFGRWKTP